MYSEVFMDNSSQVRRNLSSSDSELSRSPAKKTNTTSRNSIKPVSQEKKSNYLEKGISKVKGKFKKKNIADTENHLPAKKTKSKTIAMAASNLANPMTPSNLARPIEIQLSAYEKFLLCQASKEILNFFEATGDNNSFYIHGNIEFTENDLRNILKILYVEENGLYSLTSDGRRPDPDMTEVYFDWKKLDLSELVKIAKLADMWDITSPSLERIKKSLF